MPLGSWPLASHTMPEDLRFLRPSGVLPHVSMPEESFWQRTKVGFLSRWMTRCFQNLEQKNVWNYCGWFRNPAITSWYGKKLSLSTGFLYMLGGAGFLNHQQYGITFGCWRCFWSLCNMVRVAKTMKWARVMVSLSSVFFYERNSFLNLHRTPQLQKF